MFKNCFLIVLNNFQYFVYQYIQLNHNNCSFCIKKLLNDLLCTELFSLCTGLNSLRTTELDKCKNNSLSHKKF